jgi:peptide deformylase
MRGTGATASRCEVDATGLLGRCLQHELDHLTGGSSSTT